MFINLHRVHGGRTDESCIILFSFESQKSCDHDHVHSYGMGEDCTQDLCRNGSFIIHLWLAQATQGNEISLASWQAIYVDA